MSMDWPAALAAIVNSTRELPLDRLGRSARDRIERQRVAAAGRQPDGERDDLTEQRGRVRFCKASKQIRGLQRVTRMGD